LGGNFFTPNFVLESEILRANMIGISPGRENGGGVAEDARRVEFRN
jgi:hypothetical protein